MKLAPKTPDQTAIQATATAGTPTALTIGGDPLAAGPAGPRLTPLKSIRLKCIDCSGGNRAEVKRCHMRNCALWPFRMGKNPRRRPRTPEQQLAARELGRRLAAIRKAKKNSCDSPAGTPRPTKSRPNPRRAKPTESSLVSRKNAALGVTPEPRYNLTPAP